MILEILKFVHAVSGAVGVCAGAQVVLTAENVAHRLNVSTDWVWDHSSRRAPLLPVIRIGDGILRYRQSQIEELVHERERLSNLRRKPRLRWGRPLFFPTEIEKHMGTSHQKGWVMVRGKKWYGYFRRTVLDPAANEPKPIITPVVLGLKSEMTKFEAREKLEREIARLTGHTTEEGGCQEWQRYSALVCPQPLPAAQRG